MHEIDLALTCVTAFGAVFALLIVFAVVIRLITVVFPESEKKKDDAAVVAAISAAVTSMFPGARIARIEVEP